MNKKFKRLIKSEIYEGFNKGDIYYEVFKNPTSNEISEIKKLNQGIRGVIDRGGDKYIWNGDIAHYGNNGITDFISSVPVNYFRFAWSLSDGWLFHEGKLGSEINLEEFKEIMTNNKDFLSQIGSLSKISVMGLKDLYYKDFNSLEQVLNYQPPIPTNYKN